MPLHRLGPHCYFVQGQAGAVSIQNQGFMSNAGFVVTDDGVVVFDALGTPALAQRLVEIIRKRTSQPIRRVILSHYHADHVYGLQVFEALGAEIWAQRRAGEHLNSAAAQQRLEERRRDLAPWIDAHTHLVTPDHWIDEDAQFKWGGVSFTFKHVGPAHSPEDLAMLVEPDEVLYSGDVVYVGRIPFIGDGDSRAWLAAIDRLAGFHARVLAPGHGPASDHPVATVILTRDYLTYLRDAMGRAVQNFTAFDDAYAHTDWSRYEAYPAFAEANRANAYNTYLQMEAESLKADAPAQ
jgi:glyoxylase-like metal-dependent hydrolase (beta-lactamase superfamily II)